MKKSIVAFIPARSGSDRIPNKNIKEIQGHPLMAYTIAQAKAAGIFDMIIVTSDSRDYLNIAEKYGAFPLKRPFPISEDLSPDIDWVLHGLKHLEKFYTVPDAFSILRPTSPFRTPKTIQRAWDGFKNENEIMHCDSLRAVATPKQHPYKMWKEIKIGDRTRIEPLFNTEFELDGRKVHGHSSPTQAFGAGIVAQTAALEIAWSDTPLIKRSIAGDEVMPFYMPDIESIDINTPADLILIDALIAAGHKLPHIGERHENS